jgi:8-oxo-dGTP pyrophosphatase MutT (NUDIX family)
MARPNRVRSRPVASGHVVVERPAARVLVLAEGSVLLLKGVDPARPDAGSWWFTPGGGVDAGESLQAAAVREVFEETGLRLDVRDLGPVVASRVADFEFDHQRFRQTESFFAVEVAAFAPKDHGWDDLERRALLDQRWWSVDELLSTAEKIYPRELANLVQAVLDGKIREAIPLSGS